MFNNDVKYTPAVTCLVCQGNHKRWDEKERGVYVAQYCRWCTQGKMTAQQMTRWNERTKIAQERALRKPNESGVQRRFTPSQGSIIEQASVQTGRVARR